jgi:hypothetical protein
VEWVDPPDEAAARSVQVRELGIQDERERRQAECDQAQGFHHGGTPIAGGKLERVLPTRRTGETAAAERAGRPWFAVWEDGGIRSRKV